MSRRPLRALRSRLGQLWRGNQRRTWKRRHERYLRDLERSQREARRKPASDTPGRLFVVVNIDTEGPCQWCKNRDWSAIAQEVEQSSAAELRHRFADSAGRPLVLSWFVVHWVGAEHSARGRALGFHQVYDRYRDWVDEFGKRGLGDQIYWHYHHVLPGNVESSNRDWNHFPLYEEVLSRLVLERNHFPSCYRAGNTWEDAAGSRWLERWMPFDFSNRAPQRGSNFNWSRAPTEWTLYTPSADQVQRPGDQHRKLARSLSIENGWFRTAEIEAAFQRARAGHDSYISFFTHDYKNMAEQIKLGMQQIDQQARRYPEIEVCNAAAAEAIRQLTGGERRALRFAARRDPAGILLSASAPLQGPQPWIAARRSDGQVLRLDTTPTADAGHWRLPLQLLEGTTELAVGGADTAGNTATLDLTAELSSTADPHRHARVF